MEPTKPPSPTPPPHTPTPPESPVSSSRSSPSAPPLEDEATASTSSPAQLQPLSAQRVALASQADLATSSVFKIGALEQAVVILTQVLGEMRDLIGRETQTASSARLFTSACLTAVGAIGALRHQVSGLVHAKDHPKLSQCLDSLDGIICQNCTFAGVASLAELKELMRTQPLNQWSYRIPVSVHRMILGVCDMAYTMRT